MNALQIILVILFCCIGAGFLFALSYKAECDDEMKMQQRLHPKGK
jgi:hypothetical protein